MEGVRSLSAHCLGCIAVSFWWVQLAWVDALVPPRPKLYLSICLQNYRVPFSLTCALGFFHACQIGISCPPVMGPDRLVGVGREEDFVVTMCRKSWCRCPKWHGDGIYETDWTILHRKICPIWCWLHLWFAGWVPVLVEVSACIIVSYVSVYLDLSLYLFFYLHRDSYVAPLGVL